MEIGYMLEDLLAASPCCRVVSVMDLASGEPLVATAMNLDWLPAMRNYARQVKETLVAAQGLELLHQELGGVASGTGLGVSWEVVLFGEDWALLGVGDRQLGLLAFAAPAREVSELLFTSRSSFASMARAVARAA
jgi:hypothetical protein